MNRVKKSVRFNVELVPALATNVGISGARHLQEVGGVACLAAGAGILVYFSA